jgi:hypothetical protein
LARTELRLMPHTDRPGEVAAEVWYDGKFIATVVGADGPRVRVMSTHRLTLVNGDPDLNGHDVYVDVNVE